MRDGFVRGAFYRPGMTERQTRILAVLVGLIALVFVLVIIAMAVGGGGDEAETASPSTSLPSEITTTLPAIASSTTGASVPTTTVPTAPSTLATTTTAPTTTTTAATTTTLPVGGGLVLRADGIGAVPFGASPDEAVTVATAALGPPSADSGWIDAFSVYGTCPPPLVRGVEWGSSDGWFGFVLLFTQAPTTHRPDGGEHFFGYYYVDGDDPFGLGTPENIFIGSTIAEAGAAYPTLWIGSDDFGISWIVDDTPADDSVLFGSASGETPGDLIETINGGIACAE